MDWAKKTFKSLKDLGVEGTFVSLERAEHELVQTELSQFKDWLLRVLPEKDA